MIVLAEMEQLSPEWFAARAGIPSASCFDKIVTSKGEPSKSAKKYMMQLAGERVIGTKEESYTNAAMQRGIELEGEARALYEMMHDVEVQEVGICYRDKERSVSCSPDGLVGAVGGLEIKCPSLSVHVEYLMGNKLPTTYFQQVHGTIYVTGREWWDFMSYYPGMKPLIVRVTPDENFSSKLNSALEKFNNELNEIQRRIS